MNRFDFENKIKQLVLHLESLISNAEHFSSEGSEKANQTINNSTQINHILSCQIVNFGSEAGKLNNYDVYNYCHTLKKYEDELEKHFKDTAKNKSILSIEKERNDDGIWYSKRVPKTNATPEINLEYQQRTTVASYEVYSSEDECKAQWNNWRDLMFGIYENANSVFSKNIRIELSGKKYLYSGIYITFACRLNYKQIGIIGRICETLLNDVAFEDLIPNLHKNIQTHALQSAVAQVFARNFAHNIGSHVAIRATNRMAKDRITKLYKIEKTKFKDNTEIENWLDYMGEKLDLYEVARNEFLAEYKLAAKNAMLYRDVILPFCENTLLMDNIAHSEGIHYDIHGQSSKLKIKVFIKGINEPKGKEITATYPYLKGYKTDSEILYPDKFPYLLESREVEAEGKKIKYTIDEAFTNKLFAGTNDIEICLTNEHSLYSILENLIRNSAKHNKSGITEKEGLIISVNIEDENDDYYRVQISDNVSKVSQEQLNKFAQSIGASLITNDGEIQKESLGIADIKINAHLLKTDADITNANLSQALTLVYDKEGNEVFVPYNTEDKLSKDEKYNFGYQFKLCKPKKVIWIGQEDNSELKKKGIICLKDYAKFKPEKGDNTDNPLASYQFAILELDTVKNLTNESPNYEWDDFIIKLPHRVLLNCTKDESKKIEEDTVYRWIKDLKEDRRIQLVKQKIELPTEKEVDENENWDFDFLKKCWENWLRKWKIDEENVGRLVVYFEEETFYKNWKINFESAVVNFVPLWKGSIINDITISENERVVIYDHHSAGFEKIKSIKQYNFISTDSLSAFDKSSTDFVEFAFPFPSEFAKRLFVYEALEAGLSKIAIVDERIAENIAKIESDTKHILGNGFKSKASGAFNNKIDGNFSDLANNGNTILVSKFIGWVVNKQNENFDINLSGDSEDSFEIKFEFKNIQSDGDDFYTKQFSAKDYFNGLIIHRTYLMEFLKMYKEVDEKLMLHLLYKYFKRVIVVSGGGYPHSIKAPLAFKPFSILKMAFGKYPNKITLNRIL